MGDGQHGGRAFAPRTSRTSGSHAGALGSSINQIERSVDSIMTLKGRMKGLTVDTREFP